jgi:hypothetical protein
MGEIGHQVLDHVHVRQRGDADFALQILDRGGAGEAVLAVHVHRARTADAFAARTAEGQGRIDLVLDLEQRVEHHRAAFVEIDLELVVARVLAAVGIVAVDGEHSPFDRFRGPL